MPARHISSQSFDEILSDLGDDPAIPDPHGIRKPPPQQSAPAKPSTQGKVNHYAESFNLIQLKHSLLGFLGPIVFIGLFIAMGIAFFIAYQALNADSQSTLEESQKQISELRKEMTLMWDEVHQDQADLYSLIDEIEVSVHSLKDKKPEIRILNKVQIPAHESELRSWRYLGTSQMGASHQAHFHTGKKHLVFEKGSQILGEWRLSNIEKELVAFTHPHGKSLVLKASKSE